MYNLFINMYGLNPEFLEKLNPVTLAIFEKIKVNTSTIITQSVITVVAYNAVSINNYYNSEELTRLWSFFNFKKIIYVIGLIKRELEKELSEFTKTSFVSKLVSMLLKINDMIIKYNIQFGDIQKILDQADDELIIAQFTKDKFLGVATTIDFLNANIKKIGVNNSTETDARIRNSVNLDVFLQLKYIKYVIENYKEIVNPQTETDLLVLLNNTLFTANNFIDKMIETIEFIKFFETSDKIIQQIIIDDTNKNYIKAILDV